MHRGVLAGTRLAEAARQAERGGGGGRWSEAVGAGRGRVLAVAGAVWGAVEGGYRLWLSRQAPLVARCARSRRCGAGAVQGGRDKKEKAIGYRSGCQGHRCQSNGAGGCEETDQGPNVVGAGAGVVGLA